MGVRNIEKRKSEDKVGSTSASSESKGKGIKEQLKNFSNRLKLKLPL